MTLDGSFDVGDGRELAIRCWGEGSPTVFYDAGTESAGIDTVLRVQSALEIARLTRLCTYDRAGLGQSDPPPDRARTIDDVVDELHALLTAAEVEPPYLFVGSSGGGFDVYHQAGRFPDEVVGIVMDDVPAPQANISPEGIPPWNENAERVDYIGVEHQLAVARLPIPAIPVTVVTADQGQSDAANQALWLEGSSHPVATTVASGHDVFHGNPQAIVQAVTDMLAHLRE